MPATRSPTWWSVTPGPTAVTTPAKSVPSCGRRPSKARVAAEGDQHVGEVDARRADRDLDLARPGRDPFEAQRIPATQVTGGADLQTHAVALGVRRGGRALVGPQRRQAQPGGVPLPVAPCRLVLVGARQQLAAPAGSASGRLVDVDLGGPQVRVLGSRSPASGRAARPARDWRRRRRAPSARLLVTTNSRGGSPGDLGQFAGDAHQVAHVALRPRRAGLVVGAAVARSGHDHHAAEMRRARAVRVRRLGAGVPWSASSGQDIVVTSASPAASARRPARSPPCRSASEVLISSQLPGSATCRLRAALRGCHSMVSSRSSSTRSRLPLSDDAGAHPQALDGQQHGAVLVEHVDVGLDLPALTRSPQRRQ